MKYSVHFQARKLEGRIRVPASKSISNRLLIIRALCAEPFMIHHLSDSDDSRLLCEALQKTDLEVDIHHAGTAMRFLTAFFAATGRKALLTGSERMQNRPIAKLVDALIQMGAKIAYANKTGYPPLLIEGNSIQGGCISIDSTISSQYISALMMVAPTLAKGLKIELSDTLISSSYVAMTKELMQRYGVKVEQHSNCISIENQAYKGFDTSVEGDWSGVSYWYQMAALAPDVDLYIDGLQEDSLQGDARVAELFAQLGVKTSYLADGIRLTKAGKLPEQFNFNFIENPDLAQTFAVTLVMLGIPFRFEGCQTLKIKETDRIVALQNELFKFGAQLNYSDDGTLWWTGSRRETCQRCISIPTYQDHRMAMAFAPIGMCGEPIIIQNPEVVSKSYPGYWNDLRKCGFEIVELND
jgi:3-phosphoshikimate 1-carboxyvinyltransferase